MFFNQSETVDFKKYIKEQWVSIPQFHEKLVEEGNLFFKGYGFLSHEVTNQFSEFLGYHIIKINNRVFGFCGENLTGKKTDESSPLIFKNITEFTDDVLHSPLFESSQYIESKNTYNKLDAELNIEAKIYLYQDEEKLLLSKKGQGNIDLYCSYQIKTSNNGLICKIYPATFTAAKHLAMSKILEQRIQNLKK